MELVKLGNDSGPGGAAEPAQSLVDAVARIDAELLALTQRLREANEGGEALPLEELAAMVERQIERNRFLVDNGVIPRELLDDAVKRQQRIRKMMNGGW
jgi:hypothetical protein